MEDLTTAKIDGKPAQCYLHNGAVLYQHNDSKDFYRIELGEMTRAEALDLLSADCLLCCSTKVNPLSLRLAL